MGSTNETPVTRFSRVASLRTNNALKQIRNLAKCTGTSYKSTPEQQKKIISALRAELNYLEAVFAGKEAGEKGFTV